jgi:hypothetical protein
MSLVAVLATLCHVASSKDSFLAIFVLYTAIALTRTLYEAHITLLKRSRRTPPSHLDACRAHSSHHVPLHPCDPVPISVVCSSDWPLHTSWALVRITLSPLTESMLHTRVTTSSLLVLLSPSRPQHPLSTQQHPLPACRLHNAGGYRGDGGPHEPPPCTPACIVRQKRSHICFRIHPWRPPQPPPHVQPPILRHSHPRP